MGPSDHFTRMWTWCGRCKLFGTGCILGRAPRTKETLPYFHEWCRVARHARIFRGLTSCQRDTPDLGCHRYLKGSLGRGLYFKKGDYRGLEI